MLYIIILPNRWASHPITFVSTSPLFIKGHNAFNYHFSELEFQEYGETYIGNDVWIGANCLICSGIKVGDGAVIGMESVVTRDVGPYEIWAGCPAKMIRKRFDDAKISRILKLRWWDMSDEKIKRCATTMNDVDQFIELIQREDLL